MDTDPGSRLEIGRVAKPHGLHGEVLVKLTTTEESRVEPGTVLYTGERALVVVSSSRHQHRWIVAFEGVDSRPAAEALSGVILSAPPKADADDDDPGALWVHELVGAVVVDADGREWGPVVSVLDNPASDLLELASGALVPLRFVVGGVEHAPTGRIVRVDPPDGLLA
jgi:16S rRNA processing protein RimM